MADLDLSPEQTRVTQDNKSKRRPWLWTCGGCTFLLCVVLGITAFLWFSAANESYPLQGEVSFPSTVRKGDDFDFVVTLTNSKTEPVFIRHFTLQNYVGLPSLLDSVRIISVAPNMESEPMIGKEVQYPYFQEIKSGETLTVVFHMRAENPGTYFIDVGVYARHPVLAEPAFMTAFWFGPAEIEITP